MFLYLIPIFILFLFSCVYMHKDPELLKTKANFKFRTGVSRVKSARSQWCYRWISDVILGRDPFPEPNRSRPVSMRVNRYIVPLKWDPNAKIADPNMPTTGEKIQTLYTQTYSKNNEYWPNSDWQPFKRNIRSNLPHRLPCH